MSNRDFSESAKLIAIAKSMRDYHREMRCAICHKIIPTVDQCVFDPIVPFERGGEPTEENCQVICADCSREKAKKGWDNFSHDAAPKPSVASPDEVTKEAFDQAVADYIARNHVIRVIDFMRINSPLPSFEYVTKYYGDFNTLKRVFENKDLPTTWNREKIKAALQKYAEEHGNFGIPDLTNNNKLPSLKFILQYYPEYKTLAEFKQAELGLGRVENLETYKNAYVTEEDIEKAVDEYFGGKERTVGSMKEFFETFPYSYSTIYKRFGSIAAFTEKCHITVGRKRKASYTKQEIDDAVQKWIQEGKGIPFHRDLGRGVLPSVSAIQNHYKNWKDPFVYFQRLEDEKNANDPST